MYQQFHKICLVVLATVWSAPLFSQQAASLVPYRKGQLWGYADPETGKVVVAPAYDSVGFFRATYSDYEIRPVAIVKRNGLYGMVNQAGTLVLPTRYSGDLYISDVCPGFFAVENIRPVEPSEDDGAAEYMDRPIAFFDAEGRPVGQPFAYQNRVYDYDEGGYREDVNGFDGGPDSLERLGNTYQFIWKNEKQGLFDLKKGKVVVEPAWDYLYLYGNTAIGQEPAPQDEPDRIPKHTLFHLSTGKIVSLPDSVSFDFNPRPGRLIVAKHSQTQRYGFMNEFGVLVIPLQFKMAHPFSRNGLTKVCNADNTWSVIDTTGKEIVRLKGYNSIYIGQNRDIWLPSDSDHLYRRLYVSASDRIGQMGLDYPPGILHLNGKVYWQAVRHGKTALLDQEGNEVLPFEFAAISVMPPQYLQLQDTAVWNRLFSVTKNGRRWLFERSTLRPFAVNILPGAGLSRGSTFDKSNFNLLEPLSGDSLFVIGLSNGQQDILNVRTGARWNFPNARGFYLVPDHQTGDLMIQYQPINGELPYQRLNLQREIVYPFLNHFIEPVPGAGKFFTAFDEGTHTFILLDSLKHKVTSIPLPAEVTIGHVQLMSPQDGRPMVFIRVTLPLEKPVVVDSTSYEDPDAFMKQIASGVFPEIKQVIYSLDGRLLSPPDIADIWIAGDYFIGKRNKKYGAYNYVSGRQVLPFFYRRIQVREGKLSAIDSIGTERVFDKNGKLLRTYPIGYASNGVAPGSPLQVVYGKKNARYVNEKLQFVDFPNVINVQPFSEGLAAVQTTDKSWKFIRPSGEQAFEGVFKQTWLFYEGTTLVQTPDGRMKAIDSLGKTILESRVSNDFCNYPIGRLGKNYFVLTDSFKETVYNRSGQVVLKNCVAWENQVKNGAIVFFCDQKPGKLFEDGRIYWYQKTDFVTEKTESGTHSVLKDFPWAFEGLLDSATGEWIVAPAWGQRVSARPEEAPLVFVTSNADPEQEQIQTVVNKVTRKIMATTGGYFRKVDGLGWLVYENEGKDVILFNTDFTKKIPWNSDYMDILWDVDLGLYVVRDQQYKAAGYISKNGHILFENE